MDPKPRLIALPRPWLDREECRRLNDSFYGNEPHEYFDTRLRLLVLAAANPDAVFEAFKTGLEYGALKVGGPETTTRTEGPEAEAAHQAYITADAVNLLHHASETLMRFYFAHRPDRSGKYRPCPWLEIVDEVNPDAFKRLVERRFLEGTTLTEARRAEVTATFYGSADAAAQNPLERERVNASVDEIERWLQHFAQYFIGEAKLYNAMKHGLAIRSGQAFMELTTPADEERLERGEKPLLRAGGPSIEYLARRGRDEPFARVTRWVHPDVLMAETLMAAFMLESIWTVGKARYVDASTRSGRQLRLRFYDQTKLHQVLDAYLGGEPARVVMQTMEMNGLYRWAYPPQLVCTSCGRSPDEGEKQARRRWRAITDGESPLEVLCPECAAAFSASR